MPVLGFTQKVFVTENHQSSDFVISFVDDIEEADWVWSLTTDIQEADLDLCQTQEGVLLVHSQRGFEVTIVSHPYYAEKRVFLCQILNRRIYAWWLLVDVDKGGCNTPEIVAE